MFVIFALFFIIVYNIDFPFKRYSCLLCGIYLKEGKCAFRVGTSNKKILELCDWYCRENFFVPILREEKIVLLFS